VTQKKSSPLLVSEALSGGRILFGKPDCFRWESDKPDPRIVVADGTTLTVYFPDQKEAERHEQRDQFAARMVVEFMASGMSGSLADLEKRFQVEVVRKSGALEMTLTPKARWFRRAVASITVFQREGQAIPERIVVLGAKGDRTETSLDNVTINPPLAADAFTLKLPPGVRMWDAKARAESGIDGP
jgi:outer membrane lipoprotein-sorting protein